MTAATPRLALYDARGNRYLVAPREAAAGAPSDAATAASTAATWGPTFLGAIRSATGGEPMDGVVIGFTTAPPFEVIIMNTDGSLAERSGNGLTIFARAMADAGRVSPSATFDVRVHHSGTGPNPLVTRISLRDPDEALVELGAPSFGAAAVSACAGAAIEREDGGWRIPALRALDPRWERSVLVRVGNPHCVTFVASPDALPDRGAIAAHWAALEAIAFERKAGNPHFQRGINLQWAAVVEPAAVEARIFERGEGWTQSSGSSASAVAAAAFALGRVGEGAIEIRMPGGTASVVLEASPDRSLRGVTYAGRTQRLAAFSMPGDRSA